MLEGPELFGMHENANLTSAMAEASTLLSTCLSLMSRSGAGASDNYEEKLVTLSKSIAQKVPAQYDVERVEIDFPITYDESMNTVLLQELQRFNRLTGEVKTSLKEIQRAIKGEVRKFAWTAPALYPHMCGMWGNNNTK